MSLIETKTIDQITITENGTVLYREATRVLRNGEQIAQTFHRSSLTPGADLNGVPNSVIAIAQAAWTPEVLAAYQAEQDRIAAEQQARAESAARAAVEVGAL